MDKNRLQNLLDQYFDNTISKTDCDDLLTYLENNSFQDTINDILDRKLSHLDTGPIFKDDRSQHILAQIKNDPRFLPAPELSTEDIKPLYQKIYRSVWFQIAAVLVLILSFSLYFIRQDKKTIPVAVVNGQQHIVPGDKKAVLTLADGRKIVLDNAAIGELANEDNIAIRKTKSGQLVYDLSKQADGSTNPKQIAYHNISIPKGGEYQVILPDSTKVWLNSYSSLSFPAAFVGKERRVKLTGEAYFEVSKSKERPFYVDVNEVEVRVFGTHFNIMAYNDDHEITTTLLEGSVQVAKNKVYKMLVPGQQAVTRKDFEGIVVSKANISNAVAWKNGYFVFNDENIVSIMNRVSRWYDVEVEYRGEFEDRKFGGSFYRSKSINELLHHLEKIGNIHFKIAGRRVIVME